MLLFPYCNSKNVRKNIKLKYSRLYSIHQNKCTDCWSKQNIKNFSSFKNKTRNSFYSLTLFKDYFFPRHFLKMFSRFFFRMFKFQTSPRINNHFDIFRIHTRFFFIRASKIRLRLNVLIFLKIFSLKCSY